MNARFRFYNFKVKTEKDVNYIFDIVRKKWVVLTPEEWVRQHVIHFLVFDKAYPLSLIAVERSLRFNKLTKRFDLLVYNKQMQPFLLIECKQSSIALNQSAISQIGLYNAVFGAPYLWITNGKEELVYAYSANHSYELQDDIPFFPD